MKWFRLPRPEHSARSILEPMLSAVLRKGVNDEFQRGYAEALTFAWESACLPATAETIALKSLVRAAYTSDAA